MTTTSESARLFRSLHRRGAPILLPNAWDVASARVIEQAGAPAIATASAGLSWSIGVPDGGRLARDRVLDLVARVARGAGVPVSADVEDGYGGDADAVAETVRGVADAGAVGVNLEDSALGEGGLRAPAEQAERIEAARSADAEMFIHARIDIYLSADGPPDTRLERTLERAAIYLAAGADGIFVPGVSDLETIAALAERIEAPLGVLARPGSPRVEELAAAGAARISLGPTLAEAAYAATRNAARQMLERGTYPEPVDDLGFAELNDLMD